MYTLKLIAVKRFIVTTLLIFLMVQIGIKRRGRKSENQMIVVALWGMAADFNHVEDKCQRRLFCNFIKAADKDHVSRADFTMVNMNFLTQYQAAFPVRNASQKLILTYRESPARLESTSFLTEYDGMFNFTAYYNQRADAMFANGECLKTTPERGGLCWES